MIGRMVSFPLFSALFFNLSYANLLFSLFLNEIFLLFPKNLFFSLSDTFIFKWTLTDSPPYACFPNNLLFFKYNVLPIVTFPRKGLIGVR